MMKHLKHTKHLSLIIVMAAVSIFMFSSLANAQCDPKECPKASIAIQKAHQKYVDDIIKDNQTDPDSGLSFVDQLKEFQDWLLSENDLALPAPGIGHVSVPQGFMGRQVTSALRLMTRQLSNFAMHQMLVLGTFFDAEMQLETQRQFQIMKGEAHRDYHPSKDFCWIGTNVRGLAASENRSRYNSLALNAYSMGRQLGTPDMASSTNNVAGKASRWEQFKTVYCDPKDNNWNGKDGSGLEGACGTEGGPDNNRINLDIDYTRLIDQNRTLNLSFDDTQQEEDREDVIALFNNLHGHKPIARNTNPQSLANVDYQELYFALRSAAAKRNVAENSFNAMVSMKSAGGMDKDSPANAREFLGAVMKELGVPEDEIFDYLGESPSYYAQLEILAKKLYQSPDFYVNLYDKPANVARKSTALKAIELLIDRAIYESHIRREMATSVLLSTKLRKHKKSIADSIARIN